MNVVDSSAWLEYFAGGPQAGEFARVIENTAQLLVPSVVLVEVTRRVMQQRGEDDALQVAALLHQGQVVPLDGGIALSAAQLAWRTVCRWRTRSSTRRRASSAPPSGRWTRISTDWRGCGM